MAAFFDNDFREIPLKSWRRAELFKTFQTFFEPRFDLSFEVHSAPLHRLAKARGDSFFLLSLFAIAKAYNSVPAMRQRFLRDDAIAEYNVCHPSTPLMTADGENFLQTTLPYRATFAEFAAEAVPIVEAVRHGNAAGMEMGVESPNIFCASCVPWFSPQTFVPAVYRRNQDIHVLTWFKETAAGTLLLSATFNHCFTDGFHVGKFFNAVAQNFEHPETL